MRSLKHSDISVHRLPSGLRIVHRRIAAAPVDYCGVVVRVGSRDDAADAPGMAHFVEHTIFKGTQKRSSWHIINRMERVGGELNAYTTKEETVVYCAAPAGNLSRAAELIADLVTSSRFPDGELDKEREVVADEINSYLDTPSEAVYDDFEDEIFAGTSLGHNILGTVDAIRTFDSMRCQGYLHKWYTAPNMVFFYCGAASPERVIKVVERAFAALPVHQRVSAPAEGGVVESQPHFEITRSISSHQAHTVMGAAVPGLFSKSRYPLLLLTNILGGPGLNSLLNVALREKRGYVYSVEASSSMLSDCGLFTVYFGCDADDTDKCARLVREQLCRMASDGVTARQLAQAKKQYIGQLTVASDNRESLAISTGRTVMYFDRVASQAEILDSINSVSVDDIREAGAMIADPSRLTFT